MTVGDATVWSVVPHTTMAVLWMINPRQGWLAMATYPASLLRRVLKIYHFKSYAISGQLGAYTLGLIKHAYMPLSNNISTYIGQIK